jgi:hypothetical protein
MVKSAALLALLYTVVPTPTMAKSTQFWNLTVNTITWLAISPVGKNDWGKNQIDNDPDHAVDHDERLKITDVTSGAYDVKFVDKTGRSCIVRNIQINDGTIFSIEEKSLKGCLKQLRIAPTSRQGGAPNGRGEPMAPPTASHSSPRRRRTASSPSCCGRRACA